MTTTDTAVQHEALTLFCVMSPWNRNDSEEATFEAKVWAKDHDDACRELAYSMANSKGLSEEATEAWVQKHLDSTAGLMVVLPVAETIKSDLAELLAGHSGTMDDSAKADLATIMEILARRAQK